MTNLSEKRCLPCEGGVPRLTPAEVDELLPKLPEWKVEDGLRLRRKLKFDGFMALIGFVNGVARLAEDEGHHPDFCVHYDQLDITIWTHAIGGLSENDFILAAKIDDLLA